MKYNIVVSLLCGFLRRKIWVITKQFSFSHPLFCLKGNKGVLILEYVLLLLACVAIAALVQEAFELGADDDSSGWIIKQWMDMLEVIAEDQ